MVEVSNPPMMTQAMEERVSLPAVRERAVGSMPTIMVMVVIMMGLSLTLPASSTASMAVWPLSIRVRV